MAYMSTSDGVSPSSSSTSSGSRGVFTGFGGSLLFAESPRVSVLDSMYSRASFNCLKREGRDREMENPKDKPIMNLRFLEKPEDNLIILL